jgi:glutamate/tyrosine decarboxylase-like PLP-dependent enzyme
LEINMNEHLKHDLQNLDAILEQTVRVAQETLRGINDRPVAVAPHISGSVRLEQAGLGFDATLERFQERFAPGFSGSAGARYLGFVTGGATPAALAGDWLTSVYDQNPTSSLDSSAPDLERETIGLLRELFGLSNAHDGVFVSGATMSNFVGLALAREWIANQLGKSVAQDGLHTIGPIQVFSGAAHSSVYKALSMLGMGRSSLQRVVLEANRERVDVRALERHLEDAAGPCIVVANSGTVNTVDFDDLFAILELKKRHQFWLHVDAAFGGFAALSSQHAHLVAGLDQADSICIDAHKWLNVPYDAAMQFTKHRDLQVRVFQNSAAYLGLPTENPDFVHLTPENSRRLRALATWFSLNAYGRDGYREIVERCCALAHQLGERIAAHSALELLAPVRMNVVCFGLKDANPERNAALIRSLRDDGRVFLTPTEYQGRPAIRAAFSNWRTTSSDLEVVYEALQDAVSRL